MKERKRVYRVSWIIHDTLFLRWYYTEGAARRFVAALIERDHVDPATVDIVEYRP